MPPRTRSCCSVVSPTNYTELGPASAIHFLDSIRCFHASARLPSSLNQHKMKPLRPRAILGEVILLIVQNISGQCGPWLLWMM